MAPEQSQPAAARDEIERLLTTQPFGPSYQPIVDLATGFVAGYEAFTTFESGVDRSEMVAQARAVGLDADLEIAMLRSELRAGRWLPGGRWLAVRASRRVLEDDRLAAALAVADRRIQVEVCASDVGSSRQSVGARLRSMGRGVGLAVLVGPAELARCGEGELPDLVKIEPRLTARAGHVQGDRQLVAVRASSAAPGVPIVAEGVVSAGQVRRLRAIGVEYGQGAWFGGPAPVTVRPSAIN
jgi:EAL domain-containing protein (putative c-di-GMP-specific phosphodiesterase class I)